MRKVLTIAGSDCSGGAGVQADLKTMMAHKVYGMSAITALTAQNTTGVYGVQEVEPDFLAKQIDCIMTDIFPDAVKIGMVSSKALIEMIAEKLAFYKVRNVVLDPVMISTSGSRLISEDAMATLCNKLMPKATLITPNIHEAECLCGFKITTQDDMIKAAKQISEYFKGAILIKGGHLISSANDLLYNHDEPSWFEGVHIENHNTHGTGCTLSSAIACNLAKGYDMKTSISKAKHYITGAIKDGLDLGKGSGPLNHSYNIELK